MMSSSEHGESAVDLVSPANAMGVEIWADIRLLLSGSGGYGAFDGDELTERMGS